MFVKFITQDQSPKHKHFNYFQSLSNQKLLTKEIKMPSSNAWVG